MAEVTGESIGAFTNAAATDTPSRHQHSMRFTFLALSIRYDAMPVLAQYVEGSVIYEACRSTAWNLIWMYIKKRAM
jgi:esterase/lipase superfamily enzyme